MPRSAPAQAGQVGEIRAGLARLVTVRHNEPVPKLIMRLERLPGADNGPGARHVVDLGENGRAPAASTPLARWSASVAAAHDPCVVVDVQGRVLSLSASAAELLGCSDAGVIGRSLTD